MKVVVTGAGGRTGRIAFRRMKEWPELFKVRGVVRSLGSKERLGDTDDVFVSDVTKRENLQQAFSGLDALIILTSSIPKLKPNLNPSVGHRPDFYFDEGAYPEQVDWIGQVNQIEEAKANGVQHIVLISSMGGKYQDHPLNALGDGKILIWKHKAEEYLRDSGVPYTIIRAGLLEDAEGGRRELLTGRDDELLDSMYRKLPRPDLAEVTIQVPAAADRARGRAQTRKGGMLRERNNGSTKATCESNEDDATWLARVLESAGDDDPNPPPHSHLIWAQNGFQFVPKCLYFVCTSL